MKGEDVSKIGKGEEGEEGEKGKTNVKKRMCVEMIQVHKKEVQIHASMCQSSSSSCDIFSPSPTSTWKTHGRLVQLKYRSFYTVGADVVCRVETVFVKSAAADGCASWCGAH